MKNKFYTGLKIFFRKIYSLIIEIFLLPIKFYRMYISPIKPGCCRFNPTCSLYFIQAVKEWGIIIGSALGIWRIIRCNPYSKGGYDPVPKRKRKSDKENKENQKSEEN